MFSRYSLLLFLTATTLWAASDRIPTTIDPERTAVLKGQWKPGITAQNDLGPVDPALAIEYATVYFHPAAGLDAFLAEQQNPSSPSYHHWLTPEQFGDRFGLSTGDIGKVVGWLQSQGLLVHDIARGRHWITFTGTAARVGRAFHTEIHRYSVNGETHFANATDVSVPEALESVVSGVDGLSDLRPRPLYRGLPLTQSPEYNRGTNHYLAPDDLATIYDIAPLYQAGINGTGQKIAIIGQTDLVLSDLQTYRTLFGLLPNSPRVVLYGPDPGIRQADLPEADIDLEISGAVARNATLIYVNSQSVNTSAQYAVDQNLAPVMSMSYGICELSTSIALRTVAQQANAQGITWMVSTGDSGAATCDRDTPTPQATKGATVSFPASLPEVTAVGGTEFSEGTGAYWSAANSRTLSSALSFIPEKVWNDTAQFNVINAAGGGASALFAKPVWQTGPGVPSDGARDLPDVSFAASPNHDAYELIYSGLLYAFGGTSVSTPLFAGVVALLNQATSSQGLGNINPVLYRLAQSTTDVFHDVTVGDNIVPCAQDSPNCVNGILGFTAGPGYDLASGLGSVDVSHLIAEWNTGNASTTILSATPSAIAPSDTVQLTAAVAGTGPTPSGTVTFFANDALLGTAPLTGSGGTATASLTAAGMPIAAGRGFVGALYSGDAMYLSSNGTVTIPVKAPAAGSYVIPSVTPNPVTQVGTSWPYTLRLQEIAGVATTLTVFTINGINNLGGFANPRISANGSLSASLVGSGLTVPLNRDFHFEGMDDDGTAWKQDLVVPFVAANGPFLAPAISMILSPSTVQQNPQADPSCQWSQQVIVQELSGYEVNLTSFTAGGVLLTNSISSLFGTTRLAPRGLLAATVCYASVSVPIQKSYTVIGSSEIGSTVGATALSSFVAAPASPPAALSLSSPIVNMNLAAGSQTATAALNLNFSSGTPQWTATVLPADQNWLTVSPLSGAGPATLNFKASGNGLSNGVYYALVSIQASNANPQTFQEPVAFTVGASPSITLQGVGNAALGTQNVAPGGLAAVYGTNLASSVTSAGIQPLPLNLEGVSVTVNGIAAPLWFVSPGQINFQIPFETTAGTAILGISNNGQVASMPFTVKPTGPGLFAAGGFLVPTPAAAAGQTIVSFITGGGDMTPTLATGASPPSGIPLSQFPKPRLPLTVTVGGENASVLFGGTTPGLVGVIQVNFTVPPDIAPGVQPVVVTVGGVASPPVNLTVTAPTTQ